ncbi:CHAT domain protein [Novipirellula galeiformis]|uniref:CHAT domain protein n=1 Tax=Novipirellula galeiformis TaxID=2528004 RepID=A0A5C6CLE6_9BACT|nr:CHAT domain-containing protein [Novipirellula galeiformis]TWU25278.1 CHAT domain protein [Novipirellula galeiformis]
MCRTIQRLFCAFALLAVGQGTSKAQETIESSLRQLNGEVRQISGPSRRMGGSAATKGLPEQLSLSMQGGSVIVSETDAAGSLLSIFRTYDGEKLRLGGSESTLAGVTRALTGNSPANETLSIASAPVGLAQLLGQSVFRGTSMVTPSAGCRLLSGTPTFRRASDDGTPLQHAAVEVRNRNRIVLEFTFSGESASITFDQIRRQSEKPIAALQPGQYSMMVDGKPAGGFTVEDSEIADWINEPSKTMAEFCKDQQQTAAIFRIESLLSQLDENGNPAPYLCDALDLVETIRPLTPYLGNIRNRILAKLGHPADSAPNPSGVGIESIDDIRSLLTLGYWSKAKDAAEAIIQADKRSKREVNLAKLYLAVAQGEAATGRIESIDDTRNLFIEAITSLGESDRHDAFRAHNNFANYLAGKAQSRIYNYAIQSAAEVESPLLTALWYWKQADDQFTNAVQFSDAASPADVAALSLNQARLYSTLGDFARNLFAEGDSLKAIIDFADAATSKYAHLAGQAAEVEPLVAASAAETLANIAYRRGEIDKALANLTDAIQGYQATGSLAGLASCNRTIGLMRANADDGPTARKHLMIAVEISELLREQLGLSDAGQDRAGYFAKHAYTNERLIGLLVAAGEPRKALEIAERSKAQTFEDLLKQRQKRDSDSPADDIIPLLDEAIDSLGNNTVAIEYFVGGKDVFAFVVEDGEVTAHRLVGSDGSPLLASELISRTREFLSRMEGRARRMIVEARTPNGFDKNWQHELHRYYLELIPSEARESVAEAELLVVIPHHILHYFPFAALVTKVDKQEVTKFQLPQPTFLIESGADITAAPSLRTYAFMADSSSSVEVANAIGISEFDGAPRLPGVETDLANYQEVFGESVGKLLVGKPITESQIMSAMEDEGLLFIGTHGKNEADLPLNSFLLCDADKESDGQLTAREIFDSAIGSEAIIMSACYSGLADRSPLPGDDLFGLQRAMLQAGSRSIVSGLWDVYDDTAPLLMRSTMKHFADGDTLRRSLALAQRNFVADRKAKGPKDLWIHPYFWAVYNCSGSGHTILRAR